LLKDLRFVGSRLSSSIGEGNIHTAIIFLHGAGLTGSGMQKWVQLYTNLPINGTAVLFPSARMQPYSLSLGQKMSVWHDRTEVDIEGNEDIPGINRTSDGLNELVEEVRHSGVDKVVLGGFSQGGHQSIHAVYRLGVQVDACFVLSSYLSRTSRVYQDLLPNIPPLFYSHGEDDDIVSVDWAKETNEKLVNKGVETTFCVEADLKHEMNSDQLARLFQWIQHLKVTV